MATGTGKGTGIGIGIVIGTVTERGREAWGIAMTTGTATGIEVTVVIGAVTGSGIGGGLRRGTESVIGSGAGAERDVVTRSSRQRDSGIGLGRANHFFVAGTLSRDMHSTLDM